MATAGSHRQLVLANRVARSHTVSRAPWATARPGGETHVLDASPRRSSALDLGNTSDRRSPCLPRPAQVARSGSGPDGDVCRRYRGTARVPHTGGHVGGCRRQGRMGRRLHFVRYVAGVSFVSSSPYVGVVLV